MANFLLDNSGLIFVICLYFLENSINEGYTITHAHISLQVAKKERHLSLN